MLRPRHRYAVTAVMAVVLCLMLAAPATTHTLLRAQDGLPRFEPADCPLPLPASVKAECGFLIVPESHVRETGKTFRLAVAILPSGKPDAQKVLLLTGGPGSSALYQLELRANGPLVGTFDVILLDQRGTGFSEPSLNCPEMTDEQSVETLTACRARLEAEGHDLTVFNSAESAADIADLRVALGYEAWNLFGESYGTRLALTVLRDQPTGVRSVILDSVYPPQVNTIEQDGLLVLDAFQRLWDACAADAGCNAAFPDLVGMFYSAVEALNAEPVTLSGISLETGLPVERTVRGDDLIISLFDGLRDPYEIPNIPVLIASLAAGDYTFLPLVMGIDTGRSGPPAQGALGDSYSEGMHYSVECREEILLNDKARTIELLKDAPALLHDRLLANAMEFYRDCEAWNVPAADPAIENQPVQSDVPALLLSGHFDPVTPPSWARLAAETLSRATVAEVPTGSHLVANSGDCVRNLMIAFVQAPSTPPDLACLAEEPITFTVP